MKQSLLKDLSVLELIEIIKSFDWQIIRDGNTWPERDSVK
jgi:hypothetical protein